MAQEGIDLPLSHLAGVSHAVEAQKSPEPLLIGVHGARGVAANLQFLAVALDQAWRPRRDGHGIPRHGIRSGFPWEDGNREGRQGVGR